MARQVFHRLAICITLVFIIEILMGSVAEANRNGKAPQKNYQADGKYQPGRPSKLASPSNRMSRIIGGKFTTLREYPSQVSLYMNGLFYCGGSLIGSKRQHVLTAATCVTGSDGSLNVKELFHVVLNSSRIIVFDSSSVIRQLSDIVRHPNFNSTGFLDNDIAVLKLNQPVNMKAQPVSLEPSDDFNQVDYGGQVLTTVGWGSTNYFALGQFTPPVTISNRLKKVPVTIMSNQNCKDIFKIITSLVDDVTFGGKVICGRSMPTEGPCAGDKGNPLFMGKLQIGIVSVTFLCGDTQQRPALITRISPYRQWIDTQTNI